MNTEEHRLELVREEEHRLELVRDYDLTDRLFGTTVHDTYYATCSCGKWEIRNPDLLRIEERHSIHAKGHDE